MIVKRQIPTFFSAKQIGWYLVFISLIVFSHLPVYREFNAHDIALLGGMWNYYFSNDLLNSSFTVGGGIDWSCDLWSISSINYVHWFVWTVALLVLCYGTLLICNLTFKDLYEGIKDYQMKQRQEQASMKRKVVKAKKMRQCQEVQEEEPEHHASSRDLT